MLVKVIEEHNCSDVRNHQIVEEVGRTPMHGFAIFSIVKTEQYGWVCHNGEYASVIEFCPFCGKKLDIAH